MMGPKNYRALLLDLDGTLLDIDMNRFIPAYIKRVARHFSDYIEPEDFAALLMESTGVMIENRDPGTLNETAFFRHFCRRLGQPYERVYPIFDYFYEKEFPLLKGLSRPRPAARPLLEAARKKGLKLVLATNPIFPARAVEHRLSWGGLSRKDFDLVTTVENMHFCKPWPEYYREIAARIDTPPELCLMAGNDVQEDLRAAEAGMDTFLVEGMIVDRDNRPPQPTYRGTLEELAGLIKEIATGDH